MITCREFEDFVLAYFEGELPWRQRFVFRLHLALCSECRRYLDAYQTARTLGEAAFDDSEAPVPDDVPEDLIAAVQAALAEMPPQAD